MKRVFFVVNNLGEFDFCEYIKKYLQEFSVSVGEALPESTQEYDLIILWSYRRVVPNISNKKNIIIFHSSDLPLGKGWAPIYYSLANGLEFYTISGILPASEVDSGDIVVKAQFRIKDNYTAEILRKWDSEISILLVKVILERFDGKEIVGKKQEAGGSYYPRRRPQDNQVGLETKLSNMIGHLRACEKKHPAFFYYNSMKYFITVQPEVEPDFPDDLKITFFDSK